MADPAVVQPPFLYCDQGDMERVLSASGLISVVDDLRNHALTTDEQQMIMDARVDATVTIDYYCGMKYAPGILVTSALVNRWAATLGAAVLRKHGGQPVPESLLEWALEIEQKLEKILEGTALLPGVALRRTLAPSWSFTRINPWWQFRVIRVETLNSSKNPPDSLPQNVDYQELYTPDWR